jgi:hypothetical protein
LGISVRPRNLPSVGAKANGFHATRRHHGQLPPTNADDPSRELTCIGSTRVVPAEIPNDITAPPASHGASILSHTQPESRPIFDCAARVVDADPALPARRQLLMVAFS